MIDNIPRAIPKDLSVIINTDTWAIPSVFNWISEKGGIDSYEMFKTFNCGVGLVLCAEQNNADKIINYLNDNGETAWLIGEVVENSKESKVQFK